MSETHISSDLRQSSGSTWNNFLWWVLEQPSFPCIITMLFSSHWIPEKDPTLPSIADTTWCQISYVYLPVFTGATVFLFYEGKSIFHCRALMKIHEIMYNSINISVSILQPVLYSYFVFTFLFCTQCRCVKQIYNTIYIKIMFDIGKVYMFIVWLLCFITLYKYLCLNHIQCL